MRRGIGRQRQRKRRAHCLHLRGHDEHLHQQQHHQRRATERSSISRAPVRRLVDIPAISSSKKTIEPPASSIAPTAVAENTAIAAVPSTQEADSRAGQLRQKRRKNASQRQQELPQEPPQGRAELVPQLPRSPPAAISKPLIASITGMDTSNDGETAWVEQQTSLPEPAPTLALQSCVYHYYRRSTSSKLQAKSVNISRVIYPSPERERYLVRALVASSEAEKGIVENNTRPDSVEEKGE